MSLVETLEEEITRRIRGSKFHLIDIKLARRRRTITIKIFIDREDGGLSHQDCCRWNSEIQDYIDAKSLINGDYRLEISSPGIDQPLKFQWQFRKNLGRNLKCEYVSENENTASVKGILDSIDDYGFNIIINGKRQHVDWNNLRKAQVQTPW